MHVAPSVLYTQRGVLGMMLIIVSKSGCTGYRRIGGGSVGLKVFQK